MLKFAIFADFHLGYTTYGSLDSVTGLNSRVLNALESLDKMIAICINENIKYMIFAGDAYKNSIPSPTIQKEFDKRIKYAADNGMTIYIMSGNHDVSSLKTAKSPLETFKTLRVENVYHSRFEKKYIINDNLQILMMPTYCNEEDVKKILSEELDRKTIIVLHGTIKGAKLNDWLIEQNEDSINIDVFKKKNIIAVTMGHLHKYQVLSYDPLIFYSGSLQRIDFTEEKQPKGFVILTVDEQENNVSHEFIEIPSQKFFTQKMDLSNSSDEMEDILNELQQNELNIKNSIFRLLLDVKKDNNIEDGSLIKKIKSYSPTHIAMINKNIIDKNNIIKNSELTEDINEEKALRMYFKDHENAEKIIDVGLNMIKKLQNKNLI